MGKITLEEIAKIIRGKTAEPPYNLEDLCLDSSINKWAKWKPVNYTKVGQLTDAQRASVGYGLKANPNGAPISFSGYVENDDSESMDLYEWIDASLSVKDNDVVYDKPSAFFRLTDFVSEDYSQRYFGGEQTTYYLTGGSTTLPTLKYNEDNGSNSIKLSDLTFMEDFEQYRIDDWIIATFYKEDDKYCFVKTSVTVKDLQAGWLASPSITPKDNVKYKGFMVAINPDIEGDYANDFMNNSDAASTQLQIMRFPCCYFEYYNEVAEEKQFFMSFNTDDFESSYGNHSYDTIFYDQETLRVNLMFSGTDNEIENLTVKLYVDYDNGENAESTSFSTHPEYEYLHGSIEVPGDFGEYIGEIGIKIWYKYTAGGVTRSYWMDLVKGGYLTNDPGYTRIKNIKL